MITDITTTFAPSFYLLFSELSFSSKPQKADNDEQCHHYHIQKTLIYFVFLRHFPAKAHAVYHYFLMSYLSSLTSFLSHLHITQFIFRWQRHGDMKNMQCLFHPILFLFVLSQYTHSALHHFPLFTETGRRGQSYKVKGKKGFSVQ